MGLNVEIEMKEKLHEMIRRAETVCVLGHTSPDGDCVGSTLGISNYIRKLFPEKKVQVYLEDPSPKFGYLTGFDRICCDNSIEKNYDLCVVCDCAEPKRIGKFMKYLSAAGTSFLMDHHITNEGFCDAYVIRPEASSTCEVLYDLLEEDKIDRDIAECIYTGIIHDTGVFKYNSTSLHTMEISGKCMEKGIRFSSIIDDSFYSMNFRAKRLLGLVLSQMQSEMDGKIVYGRLDRKQMLEMGIENSRETDGFIDNIRTTDGSLAAVFFYPLNDGGTKVSMRSNTEQLDVSLIAREHEGGGHKMAAGCTIRGNVDEGIRQIIGEIRKQLEGKT